MDWILEQVTGVAQQVLVTVLLAALSLGSAYALAYIRRKSKALQAATDAEVLDRTIARAAALAESTVLAIESTTAKALRQAVKDGTKSRDELIALGEKAASDVLSHLGDEGKKVLDESLGDAKDFVQDLVEANVEKVKRLPFVSSPDTSGA